MNGTAELFFEVTTKAVSERACHSGSGPAIKNRIQTRTFLPVEAIKRPGVCDSIDFAVNCVDCVCRQFRYKTICRIELCRKGVTREDNNRIPVRNDRKDEMWQRTVECVTEFSGCGTNVILSHDLLLTLFGKSPFLLLTCFICKVKIKIDIIPTLIYSSFQIGYKHRFGEVL